MFQQDVTPSLVATHPQHNNYKNSVVLVLLAVNNKNKFYLFVCNAAKPFETHTTKTFSGKYLMTSARESECPKTFIPLLWAHFLVGASGLCLPSKTARNEETLTSVQNQWISCGNFIVHPFYGWPGTKNVIEFGWQESLQFPEMHFVGQTWRTVSNLRPGSATLQLCDNEDGCLINTLSPVTGWRAGALIQPVSWCGGKNKNDTGKNVVLC